MNALLKALFASVTLFATHAVAEELVLSNASVRVALSSTGGRITEYALNGQNILYRDPEQANWKWNGKGYKELDSGRCDIGPPAIIPKHFDLWLGEWQLEKTGDLSARMTSVTNEELGVQLIREVELAKKGSELRFTQIIKNISSEQKRYCHFGRTFVTGDGTCIVPLNPASRYPKGYLQYERTDAGQVILLSPPDDPAVTVKDGALFISEPPRLPKLAIDSMDGWIAFHSRRNLLFVKQFKTFPDQTYGEPCGNTVAIWYSGPRCELEPLGPWEWIEPGKMTSFTETWSLIQCPFSNTESGHILPFIRKTFPPR